MLPQKRVNTLSSECEYYLINKKCITDQDQNNQEDQEMLIQRVQHLQEKLAQAKARENKLKVVNTQLTNMLLSSKQANLKKTVQFVEKVENIVEAKVAQITKFSYSKGRQSSRSKRQALPTRNTLNYAKPKHQKRWSNFDTTSTLAQNDHHEKIGNKENKADAINKTSKFELKQRMGSVKRMQKQLKSLQL